MALTNSSVGKIRTAKAGLLIRKAIDNDARRIAALSVELGYDVRTSIIRRRLKMLKTSRIDLVIVAALGKSIVGWLQAHAATIIESGLRVEITGLIVSPRYRRRGIGCALVAAAEEWAIGLTAEAIVVRSNVQRRESHEFYPAIGYTRTKTQNVYRKRLEVSSRINQKQAMPV